MPDTTSLFRGMPPKSLRPDQKKELHSICRQMERLRNEQGFATADDFATAAGHSVSTWHAWRRNKPTSPKFFDLRDFARAVGLDVTLVLQDSASSVSLRAHNDGGDLTTETMAVVQLMEGLEDQSLRLEIMKAVQTRAAEMISRPHSPGGGVGSTAARQE